LYETLQTTSRPLGFNFKFWLKALSVNQSATTGCQIFQNSMKDFFGHIQFFFSEDGFVYKSYYTKFGAILL